MAIQVGSLFFFCLLLAMATTYGGATKPAHDTPFNRTAFPAGFIFGAGSSAYQFEGAAHIDGKGLSIWDAFTKNYPEKTDKSTGDVAEDFYHQYKKDIALMKQIGLDSFRFSISWPRVLPRGKISGGVNQLGVKFYNNLINELLANGLVPFVTLYHFDLPQALEDEYGGLLSPKVVNDFQDYANFCFKTFGDRVKNWVTINEPGAISQMGYETGTFAPGRCSSYMGTCRLGNSATEPYIAGHNLLLCHAVAVKLYKEKYQAPQKGKIGITLVANWAIPKSNTEADQKAALRSMDFQIGWFANPITYGDYPQSMRTTVGSRLPKFTDEQSKMLKGSIDFLGVNYYTTMYGENTPLNSSSNQSFTTDSQVTTSCMKNGTLIGTPTALVWLHIYPKGIYEFLLYIKKTYNNPLIYIHENGMPDPNNASLSIEDALQDSLRITYFNDHLRYLAKAIKDGVNVKGYYAWSFLDDFEWASGYAVRFGIVYIDFKNGVKRFLKDCILVQEFPFEIDMWSAPTKQ